MIGSSLTLQKELQSGPAGSCAPAGGRPHDVGRSARDQTSFEVRLRASVARWSEERTTIPSAGPASSRAPESPRDGELAGSDTKLVVA